MRKTPLTSIHIRNSNDNFEEFDSQKNKLFNFPFLQKEEWLNMPDIMGAVASVPDSENFEIAKQENKDSCGLCAGKMVINTLLKNQGINKKINEEDVIKSLLLPKIPLLKKTIGITPKQLASGLQHLLAENNLKYTTEIRHFMSYPQIRYAVQNGSYLIFSYMGNTIDNPYKQKDGEQDLSFKGIHHPHYCVLLKIDEEEKKVVIANPFGYQETLAFKEFWQRISLHPKYLRSSKLYLPLVETGIYMPRSCVVVSKNT